MTQPVRKFGWIKDTRPVKTEPKLTLLRGAEAAPDVSNNFVHCPRYMYNQLELGSCVSNGVGLLCQYAQIRAGKQSWVPSRLGIYYFGRVLEGTVDQDSGLQIHDGVNAANMYGVCNESYWPYHINNFLLQPPLAAQIKMKTDLITAHYQVEQTEEAIIAALAAGYIIAKGFNVPDSFMSQQMADTGIFSYPSSSDGIVGGHCTVLVDYDRPNKQFISRNSWGTGWGLPGDHTGYYKEPFDFVLDPNWTSDFNVIELA